MLAVLAAAFCPVAMNCPMQSVARGPIESKKTTASQLLLEKALGLL